MIKHLSKLLILGLITTMPTLLYAKEELTVIQTVSKDRKSFVVAKGIKDGVVKGQEIIFANDTVSVVCRASEVSRGFSLWVPLDRNVTVPFNKEEIVNSNSSIYGNVALDIVGDTSLVPEEKKAYIKFLTSNSLSVKASYDRGLSQSTSSVSDSRNSGRTGYNMSVEFNYRYMPEFEVNIGARIDREVYRLTDPELDIPTKRVMATFGVTYHFVNFTDNQTNFYLTIAAGIGKSETSVNEETASGRVTLLPEIRVGFLFPFSKGMALVFEGSVDTLTAVEYYPNEGEDQTTNMINAKASVGIRF